MKKKNKKNRNSIPTFVIIVILILCIIIGIFELKRNFINFNKAIYYADKILILFEGGK